MASVEESSVRESQAVTHACAFSVFLGGHCTTWNVVVACSQSISRVASGLPLHHHCVVICSGMEATETTPAAVTGSGKKRPRSATESSSQDSRAVLRVKFAAGPQTSSVTSCQSLLQESDTHPCVHRRPEISAKTDRFVWRALAARHCALV